MKIYEEKRRSPMRWVIAFIIFVVVLTVTFDDAFGVWIPRGDDQQTSATPPPPAQVNDTKDYYNDEPPPQVPEPGTLILLGTGLAAMRFLRRKKA